MDMAKLADVVRILADGEMLPREYFDHMLHGKYEGYSECHIEPDWLLIWNQHDDELELLMLNTGTHSDFFK